MKPISKMKFIKALARLFGLDKDSNRVWVPCEEPKWFRSDKIRGFGNCFYSKHFIYRYEIDPSPFPGQSLIFYRTKRFK